MLRLSAMWVILMVTVITLIFAPLMLIGGWVPICHYISLISRAIGGIETIREADKVARP